MDTVYLYFDQCTKVDKTKVTIKDLASVYCQNKTLKNKINTLKVYSFPPKNSESSAQSHSRIIISSLKVIEKITESFPDISCIPIGSTDILVEQNTHSPSKTRQWLKTFLLCMISFFGAAFSIMAFNNDVQAHSVFQQIHKMITGQKSNGFSMIEIFYCIGLGLGIIVFYNHLGKKRLSKDPTPLEVEMRLYETDLNTSIIEGVKRKQEHLDVS